MVFVLFLVFSVLVKLIICFGTVLVPSKFLWLDIVWGASTQLLFGIVGILNVRAPFQSTSRSRCFWQIASGLFGHFNDLLALGTGFLGTMRRSHAAVYDSYASCAKYCWQGGRWLGITPRLRTRPSTQVSTAVSNCASTSRSKHIHLLKSAMDVGTIYQAYFLLIQVRGLTRHDESSMQSTINS